MIRFDNVSIGYDRSAPILTDTSIALPEGSFHFLIGDSGAGKSTLLKVLYLDLPPLSGKVHLFDRDLDLLPRSERPDTRRRIGVVFQDFRLIPHLSAHDNVALPLRLAGEREASIRKHVPELLKWVGLEGEINASPETLSGGQQQRVAIARAVISRPDLLLADEPTGNVDDRIAVRLLFLFEELHRTGTTVIIATHNEALVDRFDHPVWSLRTQASPTCPVAWAVGET